ncbi:hypothetical protein OS493_000884 [Desmophyllum pertusum]|uniref:Uncharacterized protein n=1 Tax=Desmophyllum pertusum TaxID=174260 RepID=A0A9X0D6M6_9CNID|nr:hypothetical protein OS493_000884 [Desmophyllum pertusum]
MAGKAKRRSGMIHATTIISQMVFLVIKETYRRGLVMARKRSAVMAQTLAFEQYRKVKLTLKKTPACVRSIVYRKFAPKRGGKNANPAQRSDTASDRMNQLGVVWRRGLVTMR